MLPETRPSWSLLKRRLKMAQSVGLLRSGYAAFGEISAPFWGSLKWLK
jgi:hypothetical protein